MASTRCLVLVRAEKRYVCLNCQLRALSYSSRSRATEPSNLTCSPLHAKSAARVSTPPTSSLHVPQPRFYARRPPRGLDGRRETWTDRMRKKLWENGEGPDPRAFKVPGETPEEQESRIRADEEEEASREREEKDFENLRKAGEKERLERMGDSSGSKAIELRKGFTVLNDNEEVIESGEEEIGQEQQPQSEEYKPAARWRGLRHIKNWKVAQSAPKPLFTGYLSPEKVEDPHLIERAVQRALVEAWVLKQAGDDFKLPKSIMEPTDDFEDRLAKEVAFDKDGSTPIFTDNVLHAHVERSLGLRSMEEVDTGDQEETFDRVDEDMIQGYPEEGRAPPRGNHGSKSAESFVEESIEDFSMESSDDVIAIGEQQQLAEGIQRRRSPLNQSYRRVAFTDWEMKFMVVKRVMQLTGIRIADPLIPLLNNAGDLVRHMVKPGPAKRLVDDLSKSKEIGMLPNVEIWETRYTEKDRETEIGRWKLIETELEKRGLPVDRLERSDGGSIGRVRLKDLMVEKAQYVKGDSDERVVKE